MLETITAGGDETEVTEETIPAAVAVPIIVIIVIAIIVMVIVASIYIVLYRRGNRYNTTIHDTRALHVSYSCYYCPQTGLHMQHTLQIPL